MNLVLASASPRRSELLSYLGLPFSIRVADIDEGLVSEESPDDYVKRLSFEKASKVFLGDECVIGADTIVVSEGKILGKPQDAVHAEEMLRLLSGSWHEVLTGVSVVNRVKRETFSVKTKVLFDKIGDDEIVNYIATSEPMDKAGAYAIQGIGGKFIREIQGSYSNVVGLPLCEVSNVLKLFL